MKNKIIKKILLIVTNTSLVLLFWFFLSLPSFVVSSVLLTLLNSVLLTKKNTSSTIFSIFLQKQYYKTKFRILNNLDNKKSFKKTIIGMINIIYQKVLFNLILIFKASEDGYKVVREDIFDTEKLISKNINKKDAKDVTYVLSVVEKIKNKEHLEVNELEKLDQLLLKFYKQKQQKFTRFSVGTIALLIIATSTTSLISTLIFSGVSNLKAATYGWVQTDWSAGADELATANHSDNQTGWTKIFSKDATVDTGTTGELSLSNSQVAITDTSDDDFNGTTMTNNSVGFYIAGGTIQLKKLDGASCSVDEECLNGLCAEGVCVGYITGTCAGFAVFYKDSPKLEWKISATDCIEPQCIGSVLVADNSVDFSEYPARDACKALGGRLPSKAEGQCMMTNRGDYEVYGAFNTNIYANPYYLTNIEESDTLVWGVYSTNANFVKVGKNTAYGVRCIRDL